MNHSCRYQCQGWQARFKNRTFCHILELLLTLVLLTSMLYNTLYYVYSGIYFSDTIFGPRLRCIKIAYPSKSVQNLCKVFVQVSKCRTLKKRNYFCSLSLIHHNNGKVVVYKNSGFWFVGNKAILKLCLRMFLLKLCIFQFLQQHTYFHICHKINQIVTFYAKFHFW